MGRKVKIKQQKKQIVSNNLDEKNFVKNFEHQGYNFKQIKRSPDLPTQKNEPQI